MLTDQFNSGLRSVPMLNWKSVAGASQTPLDLPKPTPFQLLATHSPTQGGFSVDFFQAVASPRFRFELDLARFEPAHSRETVPIEAYNSLTAYEASVSDRFSSPLGTQLTASWMVIFVII